MKTFFKIPVVVLSLLTLVFSCAKKNPDGPIACTELFASVSIGVVGGELTDYFTVQQSTGDTLRLGNLNFFGLYSYYVVDDSYQSKLVNNPQIFTFYGYITDTKVIEEVFVVSADECHIYKVSGVEQVTL